MPFSSLSFTHQTNCNFFLSSSSSSSLCVFHLHLLCVSAIMGCCGGSSAVHPLKDGKLSPSPDMGGKRKCTDVLFLLLFIVYCGGMGAIAYFSLNDGDPTRFLYGTDSFGNVCGRDNPVGLINSTNSGLNMTGRERVFFFNSDNSDALVLCVEACPTNATVFANNTAFCAFGGPYTALEDDTNRSSIDALMLDADGCPTRDATHFVEILHRCIAIPDTASTVITRAKSYFNNNDIISNVIDDLQQSWVTILYLGLIAFGVTLVMILLMGVFSFIVIWVTYILAFVTCLGAIGYMWYSYYVQWQEYNDTDPSLRLESQKENLDLYLYGGIIVSIVFGVILLILLVLRSRLSLLVALFKEAGRAIRAMPATLVMPLLTFVMVILAVLYFVVVYLFLYSISTPTKTTIGHVKYEQDQELVYMQWYHIFGFLWIIQLFFAIQQFIVAGAVAQWYFKGSGKLGWPILNAVKNSFRYHLGSLALGSMLIALLQLVRLLLAYVQKKLKGRTGAVVDALMKCCQCCLWLLEKFLKFLNKNAYIEIAIYGYPFCKAAREAFSTLVRNALRVATINSVGSFVLFLSRLVVASVVGFAALYWMERNLDLAYPAVSVIIAAILAWFVAGVFTSVYDLVIDCVFLCFAEDSERNDGSLERPLYASKRLIAFMDKSKRQLQKQTLKSQADTHTKVETLDDEY
eukprot:m.88547 g.88547  ORF g.88547 m.88547 type:complete len:688 (-) comp12269_c2_seq1:238-2301(-)